MNYAIAGRVLGAKTGQLAASRWARRCGEKHVAFHCSCEVTVCVVSGAAPCRITGFPLQKLINSLLVATKTAEAQKKGMEETRSRLQISPACVTSTSTATRIEAFKNTEPPVVSRGNLKQIWGLFSIQSIDFSPWAMFNPKPRSSVFSTRANMYDETLTQSPLPEWMAKRKP